MAQFVRAQIFGTTFEITSRYSDLQPVGMGAFGLVWYVDWSPRWLRGGVAVDANRRIATQLGQRPAHQPECRHQEDHEALQHPGARQENLQRTEAAKTLEA